MINDVARKSIHVDAANNIPIATVKEYDDFILKLALLKYNTPFDCTGQTATLGVKAPSGLFEQTTDIIINKDQIDIKLKTGIVSKSGICEMELKLVDITGSMTTASFFIAVNRKILNDEAVEASDEFDSLTEAKKMEPIRQENELKRQENEKGRVEAEKLRVQAETDRAAAEEIREQQELARQTCYKEIEESRKDFDGGIHKNLKLRLMRDLGDIYERFNKANLLPYEAEYISASNSYKGMTKDNVIKGKTLQNLWSKNKVVKKDNILVMEKGVKVMANSTFINCGTLLSDTLLKPNTKYTIILDVYENTLDGRFIGNQGSEISAFQEMNVLSVASKNTGRYIASQTTVADFTNISIGLRSFVIEDSTTGHIIFSVIILEGDYTNKPIPPYFEGIKSVNEDGETLEEVSCGKNILNWKKEEFETIGPVGKIEKDELGITFDCLGSTTGGYGIKTIKTFHLKPNTQYTFSADWDILRGNPRYSKPYVRVNSITTNTFEGSRDGLFTFTTDNVGMYKLYLYVDNPSPEDVKVRFKDMFFSEGVEKANEPYIEHRLPIKMKNLRSLPNGICDTSDGVRRIGEIILNGSESWGNADVSSSKTIRITLSNFLECVMGSNNENIINNKLPSKYIYSSDEEGIFITRAIGNKGNIYIRVLKNKLASQDIAGFKAWLQANPITIYYELATPTKEDGNTEELRTYDGQTNIFTEGSLIEPTISCKVPSNVQAVVMNLRSENEALNNNVNTLQATTEENNLMNIETNVNQEARLTMLELGVI